MTSTSMAVCRALAASAAIGLTLAPLTASAQTSPKAKPATPKAHVRPNAKKAAPAPVPPKVEYVPAEPADAQQIDAAERVYYGIYDCEFKQTVAITRSEKFPAFVDLKHGKTVYLMKPVLSSTGAIRLEDIRGDTLMVQISSKSMLLNVKTAQRIVDDCVSPRQRELIDAARAEKAAAAAAAAASSAGGGAAGTPAPEGLLRATPPTAATAASSPR